jgi:hypothetical protein
VLNLNIIHQITLQFLVFGLMQNAFNATYYTHGTFSPTASIPLV